MGRIRRHQYLIEALEWFVIGFVAFAVIYPLSGGLADLAQGEPLTAGLLLASAATILVTAAAAGLGVVLIWGYSSGARALLRDGGCGSWIGLIIFWGIIYGPILTLILDLNTRLIVSRMYTGEKPLTYGLLFKPRKAVDLRTELLRKLEVYSEAMRFLATEKVFDVAAFERLDAILGRAQASFGSAKRQEMIGLASQVLPTQTTGGPEELRLQLQATLSQAFDTFNRTLAQVSPTPETAAEVKKILAKYAV